MRAKLINPQHTTKSSHRMRERFSFLYPLTQKAVRDLKIITEQVGKLRVEGWITCDPSVPRIDAEDRYSVELESVTWEGRNILPALQWADAVEEIEDWCLAHATELFTDNTEEVA